MVGGNDLAVVLADDVRLIYEKESYCWFYFDGVVDCDNDNADY